MEYTLQRNNPADILNLVEHLEIVGAFCDIRPDKLSFEDILAWKDIYESEVVQAALEGSPLIQSLAYFAACCMRAEEIWTHYSGAGLGKPGQTARLPLVKMVGEDRATAEQTFVPAIDSRGDPITLFATDGSDIWELLAKESDFRRVHMNQRVGYINVGELGAGVQAIDLRTVGVDSDPPGWALPYDIYYARTRISHDQSVTFELLKCKKYMNQKFSVGFIEDLFAQHRQSVVVKEMTFLANAAITRHLRELALDARWSQPGMREIKRARRFLELNLLPPVSLQNTKTVPHD